MNWTHKLAAVLLIAALAILLTFTHIGRYIFWNYANIDDYKKFPADRVERGNETFAFETAAREIPPDLPEEYNVTGTYSTFSDFLNENQTVAFLLIRNDTILYEKYFDGIDATSVLPSFSISKSFVSALTGIAIDEGLIKSVEQPVTDFLDGFKHPGFERISIRDLLEMRSGLRFSESYNNPFGHAAKFYYGKNLRKYTYRLKPVEPPGQRYEYMSGNTQILAFIIEKATGISLPEYLEEKIWKKTGTRYDASWSVDSRRYRTVKAFCCINARIHDFAKFGRLYLNKGQWQGEQVIPEWWVEESLKIRNDSRDDDGYPYTWHWRTLNDGSFFAKGIMGQYLYVNPSSNIIILRFGKGYAEIEWVRLFGKISEQY